MQRHYVGTCRRAAEHDETVEDNLNGVAEPDFSRNLLQPVDGEFNRIRFADSEVDAGVKINDPHGFSNFEGRSGRVPMTAVRLTHRRGGAQFQPLSYDRGNPTLPRFGGVFFDAARRGLRGPHQKANPVASRARLPD